jgi:CRP-like cAMP-binding protein
MENLREQVFQVTSSFLATVQQLTEQHAALVLQETFSSLDGNKQRASQRAATTVTSTQSREPKRGIDELEQLSRRFVQFVHDNPGLRIEQINKQLGTTTTELALPIRKLVSSGGLTVKGQKRSTTYFAGKSSSAVASNGESKKRPRSKGRRTHRSKPKKK